MHQKFDNTRKNTALHKPTWLSCLCLLGKIEFYIVSFKYTILSTVDEPSMLSQRNALLQNRILKCVFSVFNIIRSMYRRVFKHDSSSPLAHKSTVQYLFSAPVPISLRLSLIRCICGNSVHLLHMLCSSYLERISTCKIFIWHAYIFIHSSCPSVQLSWKMFFKQYTLLMLYCYEHTYIL